MKIKNKLSLLCLALVVFVCCRSANSADNTEHWPSELSQRTHAFSNLGAAIAREKGFPVTGTEVEKANYMFSRWPDVVEHYGLTAGTGSRPSDLTIWALRKFDKA